MISKSIEEYQLEIDKLIPADFQEWLLKQPEDSILESGTVCGCPIAQWLREIWRSAIAVSSVIIWLDLSPEIVIKPSKWISEFVEAYDIGDRAAGRPVFRTKQDALTVLSRMIG